jgi:hypothetical protein
MRLLLVVVIVVLASPAEANPPAAYACQPGTPNRGVGCTCPNGHRAKRDAEDTALCAAAPTRSAASLLLAAVNKGDLVAATELARKYDFSKDETTHKAVLVAFANWFKPAVEQIALRSARGQCTATIKTLARAEEWGRLDLTFIGKSSGVTKDEVEAAYLDAFAQALEPYRAQLATCIATASKDDGTAPITAQRDATRAALLACFDGLPEPKTPALLKIVVDADGHVVQSAIAVTWPDLDVKLANARLDLLRNQIAQERGKCFADVIAKWTFVPNPRGFAATIPVKK